jgi:hypothetical protein
MLADVVSHHGLEGVFRLLPNVLGTPRLDSSVAETLLQEAVHSLMEAETDPALAKRVTEGRDVLLGSSPPWTSGPVLASAYPYEWAVQRLPEKAPQVVGPPGAAFVVMAMLAMAVEGPVGDRLMPSLFHSPREHVRAIGALAMERRGEESNVGAVPSDRQLASIPVGVSEEEWGFLNRWAQGEFDLTGARLVGRRRRSRPARRSTN